VTIVTLTILGLLLLLAEIFLPGMIAGILGGILLLAAAVLCGMEYGLSLGLLYFVGITILGMGAFFVWLKIFPSTFTGKRLILSRSLKEATSSAPPAVAVGDEGIALTPLRPAGTARIGGVRMSVVAQMEFISEGEPVRVTGVEGSHIVVSKKLAEAGNAR
jgi:membrane-bound serine protease (ClpP class)